MRFIPTGRSVRARGRLGLEEDEDGAEEAGDGEGKANARARAWGADSSKVQRRGRKEGTGLLEE